MLKKYFSFRGRLNRKAFWLRNLALFGTALFIYFVAGLVFFTSPSGLLTSVGTDFPMTLVVIRLLFIPLILVFYVASFSLAARRLHDRNKSGWWLVGYFLILVVVVGVIEDFGPDSNISLTAQLAGILTGLWYFINLGLLKGTNGANKFGADPLTGGSADPTVFE